MRRIIVLAVAFLALVVLAGCSSSAQEAATTTEAPTVLVLQVHATGGATTWQFNCEPGEVRVSVADATGETVAIETVDPSGEPGEPFEDCTTDPVEVPVPAADIYRVSVSGVGPTSLAWSAEGEFSRDEVVSGLVVTARAPAASSIAPV